MEISAIMAAMEKHSAKRIAKVRLTLTKRTVEALELADKPWIAWDDRLTGFGVRVQPSGTKSFIVNYRLIARHPAVARQLPVNACAPACSQVGIVGDSDSCCASSRCKMMHPLRESLSAEDMPKITPMTNRTRITVGLPDEEHAALTALAERHDVSLSWLTRKAVTEFLAHHGWDDSRPALDLPLAGGKGKE